MYVLVQAILVLISHHQKEVRGCSLQLEVRGWSLQLEVRGWSLQLEEYKSTIDVIHQVECVHFVCTCEEYCIGYL